jgi:hypothetical protein
MTDTEFEKLDAQVWAYHKRRRRLPIELAWRYSSCRDCNRPDPEFYMVNKNLWQKAVGRRMLGGCLCVACLEKRLGHKLMPEDFATPPESVGSD